MFEKLRTRLLHLLRVPPDPTPPVGAPESIRVFRAGAKFYQLKLIVWAIGQVGALAGLGFALFVSQIIVTEIRVGQTALAPPRPAAVSAPAPDQGPPAPPARSRHRPNRNDLLKSLGDRTATAVIVLIVVAETGAIIFFVAQLFVSLAVVRLSFELHWYIITDRSLRIRTGILRLQETTMSFANLQQVTVAQGPLQRYLGLADVRVQSAGGGGETHPHAGADATLHTCLFEGVDNANEIRDLILARLRQFRAAGLGDPDDPEPSAPAAPAEDALTAARELLHEASALRQKIIGRP